MTKYTNSIGVKVPALLLPRPGVDMTKWAVVACDQYTSQPAYWQETEAIVGDAPSTLRIMLPELYLDGPDEAERIASINAHMQEYMDTGILENKGEGFAYVRRTVDGKTRQGLIVALDLEDYDYTKGSTTLIRATEGTVLERIPPRVRVRKDAPLELPHVMLLIDDPGKTCIEPVAAGKSEMEKLYDFDLMLGGGHLTGWLLTEEQQAALAEALAGLISPQAMEEKYGMRDAAPLLFAVGDGNHSLATAKTCYEDLKKVTPPDQWADLPARYALVEIENLHDDALRFEAIHRVLFGVDPADFMVAFQTFYPNAYEGKGDGHVIEVVWPGHDGFLTVPDSPVQLPVGTLQRFIDHYRKDHPCQVDYIHGDDVTRRLGSQPGNMGFLLPAMGKDQLFKTVMADGVLPRKTFSMGHAEDKRYYVEARRIK